MQQLFTWEAFAQAMLDCDLDGILRSLPTVPYDATNPAKKRLMAHGRQELSFYEKQLLLGDSGFARRELAKVKKALALLELKEMHARIDPTGNDPIPPDAYRHILEL